MTMRKDIEFGRGMAVPVAKKLDREGNEMDYEIAAKEELDLCIDTFEQSFAESKLDVSLKPLLEKWFLSGYKEGYLRGVLRGMKGTQRVALDTLKDLLGGQQ